MYSVKDNKKAELLIKKSKFISHIYRLNNQEEIENILSGLKKQYKDATHCCYAYIYDGAIKASDDNEPSKTAGTPILEVLKKNNLNYVLCVVIRYFGGIKLGAGGLIRAYSASTKETLINNIIELEEGYLLEINTTYDKQKELEYILSKEKIIKKEYNENIYIKVKANKTIVEKLKNKKIIYKILEKIYIEKSS